MRLIFSAVVLVIFILWSVNLQADPKTTAAVRIPPDVIRMADVFIIKQVGEDYFRNNYSFDSTKSKKEKSRDGVDYFIKYNYGPLTRLSDGSEDVTVHIKERIVMDPKNHRFETIEEDPLGYVAKVNAGTVLEPKITKAEALQIFEKQKPSGVTLPKSKLVVKLIDPTSKHSKVQTFNWSISYCFPPSSCCTPGEFLVDVFTGQYQTHTGVMTCTDYFD